MKHFVGIDLGTTNSAISSYDGSETRVWKSPEQNDVTPSVILYDKRGNKYVGKRAYDSAHQSEGNSAALFKRLMGTSTPIELPTVDMTKTPEECSAEVLKTLFGYLPEELRQDPDSGTVITVPAAFNQMQKESTLRAAEMAGLGKVALMQEPVAAVMSVMRTRETDGIFLIFDLGGGTLDVAIAENMGGRVSLLSHGGIAMCGGRDFDRALVDSVIKPWLLDTFDLPEDFSVNPQYKRLNKLASWAAEKAKIELSSQKESVISLSEVETRLTDLSGHEIYLDIPINRDEYSELIEPRVMQAIEAAREALKEVSLSSHDLERVVFVGGPTNFKPLRDKVSFELGVPGNMDVNPMTAVAEGAAVFAETIDWSNQSRSRKAAKGEVTSSGPITVSLKYIARTPEPRAKIVAQITAGYVDNAEFQIDNIDTGWTSGRVPLKHGAGLDVVLSKPGANIFKVFAFDGAGASIDLSEDRITITRTAATVDAIPASHSIGVEVLTRLGGHPELEYLVRAGDSLPKKGVIKFKAAESLKAGDPGALNFKVWEGEIVSPIHDNRAIGLFEVRGSDFSDGVIPAGADLFFEYEVQDSGNILLSVSVPSVAGSFGYGRSFYSPQADSTDFSNATALVTEEGEQTLARLDEVASSVNDPRVEKARQAARSAANLDENNTDAEVAQEAREAVLEARKLLAEIRKENLTEIRLMDLKRVVALFNDYVREHARQSECTSFDALVKTAEGCMAEPSHAFDHHLDELRAKNFEILWRQDWFVIERFKGILDSPHLYSDRQRYEELAAIGAQLLKENQIDQLRQVVGQLYSIMIGGAGEIDMSGLTNILKG